MNGLAIIEKTETQTRGFFIDQDTNECARLNAQTKKRIAQNEAATRQANIAQRKADKAEAKRKAYRINTTKNILIHGGICGAVVWAGTAGMVHPGIWIPVAIIQLCGACIRLGALFGRGGK